MIPVHVRVTLRPSILDPQGKAIGHALHALGLPAVAGVRAGKHFVLEMDTDDPAEAERLATEAASKLLANPVTEDFEIVSVAPSLVRPGAASETAPVAAPAA